RSTSIPPPTARTDHGPDRQRGASMATVAAVIASTHHPFYLKASTATGAARRALSSVRPSTPTGADRPRFADEWQARIEAFRETLTRAEPDVLVMVGSDHFPPLWLPNTAQLPGRNTR